MQNVSFTIAVMVYNIERFLPMCVDSIIAQKGDDIEILLIDDGSTDSSGKICDDYSKKDSRVRVVHQENAGQAAARTQGISCSSGQLIMFVDSDDWVEHNICETLYAAMERCGTSAAMCGYVREYPGKSLPKCIFSSDIVLTGKQVERRLCGPVGVEIGQPENMECFNTLCVHLYPIGD